MEKRDLSVVDVLYLDNLFYGLISDAYKHVFFFSVGWDVRLLLVHRICLLGIEASSTASVFISSD